MKKRTSRKPKSVLTHRVLFVLPSSRERVSNHDAIFAEAGFKLCVAVLTTADARNCKELFEKVMQDWGSNLVCVLYPQSDITDQWLINAIKSQPGNINDFISHFKNEGLAAKEVDMDWDGPFDDELCLYETCIPEILDFARASAKLFDAPKTGEIQL